MLLQVLHIFLRIAVGMADMLDIYNLGLKEILNALRDAAVNAFLDKKH
jgi:hypothetical protein